MIEDVQLGDDQGAQMIQAGAVTRRGHVKPAAAPGAARDGAILAAALAEFFALRSGGFGWKGPAAHAGGIGLGNADHAADARRPHAGTRTSPSRRGARAGHEGVSAVVEVE